MTQSVSRKCLSLSLIICTTATAMPAMAQIEEVVVTARKRNESIMKVPVTTSVLSEDALDNYAVGDISGIADKTPGLNFSEGPLASGVLVSMRGVGTGTSNPGIDQSIALVADGMQLTQGLAFKSAMFDMSQVEVLKGPQALFFGKAAPAGVISVTSADPSDEFEAKVRLGYEFEAAEKLGELIISGPVTDTLGLRLAVQSSQMDGYLDNNAEPLTLDPIALGPPPAPSFDLGSMGAAPVSNDTFPEKDTLLVRGTVVWQPVEAFKARLKLNYADTDTQGQGGEPQLVNCPEGTGSVFAGFGMSFIGGDDCKADDEQNFVYLDPAAFPGVLNDGVPFNEAKQSFGVLELNYDLNSELSLTSVTGYYDVEQSSLINGSITNQLGSPFGIQSTVNRYDLTQEFRLTSDSADPVNYMLGLFYQKSTMYHLSGLPANQTYNTFIGLLDIVQPDPDGPRDRLPPVLAWADHRVLIETASVFGQVLWDITPELELGVGARWTGESRDHRVVNRAYERFPGEFAAWRDTMVTLGLFPPFVTLPTGAVPIALGKHDLNASNWSPEISLTYTPSDDLTLYGNLKQAYKSGSFDIGGAANPGDDKSFGDERIRGGEIGLKTRQFGGSLALNAAAYYYKYKDMQVETRVFDPAAGVVAVRTTNAASSDIYGIDVDATYAVPNVQGLTVYGAVNWNISEYDKFDNAQCWTGQTQAQGCNIDLNGDGVGDAQDLSGEPLLRAPKWMANVGFDYEQPVLHDMTLRLGSNLSYSSSYSASSTNIDGYQKDYAKTSANVGLVGADNRWVVEVIGDNLTNEYTYGSCAPSSYADTLLFGQALAGTGTSGGPGGQPELACYVDRGRSLWLRLTYNVF